MRTLALAAVFSCFLAAAQPEFAVGSKVDTIRVSENSVLVSISPANAKATIVIFISTKCPISNSYNERMNAIYKDYSDRGVQFVFVNANANEPVQEIEDHAKANQFSF